MQHAASQASAPCGANGDQGAPWLGADDLDAAAPACINRCVHEELRHLQPRPRNSRSQTYTSCTSRPILHSWPHVALTPMRKAPTRPVLNHHWDAHCLTSSHGASSSSSSRWVRLHIRHPRAGDWGPGVPELSSHTRSLLRRPPPGCVRWLPPQPPGMPTMAAAPVAPCHTEPQQEI